MNAATPDERTMDLTHGWHLAVRVAFASSLFMVAIGAALYRFVGVGAGPILALTVVVGVALGLWLPPGRPSLPVWLRHE